MAEQTDIYTSQAGKLIRTGIFYDFTYNDFSDYVNIYNPAGEGIVLFNPVFPNMEESTWNADISDLNSIHGVDLFPDQRTPWAWIGPLSTQTISVRDKWLWDGTTQNLSYDISWVGPANVNESFELDLLTWQMGLETGVYQIWYRKKSGTGFHYLDGSFGRPNTNKRPGHGWLPRASDRTMLDRLIEKNGTGQIDPALNMKPQYLLRMKIAKRPQMDYYITCWQANQRVVDSTDPRQLYILDWTNYDPNTSPYADVPGWSLYVAPPGWKWPRPYDTYFICVLHQPKTPEYYGPVGGSDTGWKPELLHHIKSKKWVDLIWIAM